MLRYYQKNLLNDMWKAQKEYDRIAVVLPTGAGKTVCFTQFAKHMIRNEGKIGLLLTDRKELLSQARNTFLNAGIRPEIIKAGTKMFSLKDPRFFVGMVESVYKRLHMLSKIDFIIVDEAHRGNFKKVLEQFTEAKVFGFTATPLYGSKESFSDNYEALILGAQIPELVNNGFLSRMELMSDGGVTTSALALLRQVGIKGDYTDESQKMALDEMGAYKTLSKLLPQIEGKTIIFCVNIKESKVVAEIIKSLGYSCKAVTSETPKEERDQTLKEFGDGDLQYVTNCGILTTGYDNPSIRNVIILRNTSSLPLYLQMVGRGSRVIAGVKNSFKLYDICCNYLEHGRWDADIDWELAFQSKDAFMGKMERREEEQIIIEKDVRVIKEKTEKAKSFLEVSGMLIEIGEVLSAREKKQYELRYSTEKKCIEAIHSNLKKYLAETRRYYDLIYPLKKALNDMKHPAAKSINVKINNKTILKSLVEALGEDEGKKTFISSLSDHNKYLERYINSWL